MQKKNDGTNLMSVHWNWMFVKRSSLSLKCLSADASGKWAKMKKSERDSRIFQRHRRRMASQNTIGYGVSDSRAQQVEKKKSETNWSDRKFSGWWA